MMLLRAHVRAAKEPAARKVVKRVISLLPFEAEVQSCEKYWKDDTQYVAVISLTPDPGQSYRDQAWRLLDAAWALASPLLVSSRGETGAKGWEVEAIISEESSHIPVSGLVWASLTFTAV
jgi:hypothetical protein